MKPLVEFLSKLKGFLDFPLFKIKGTPLTLWTLLLLIILLFVLFYVTAKLRKWIVEKLLSRSRIEIGVRQAIGSIIRYVVIAIGLLIILQSVGIDLTTLNVLAGTVGIGIGIGLQNIANNFISGLIILFERPVKIGDRVEIGSVEGDVIKIGSRSTTVLTNDSIAIIVPNSKIITENVVNWSYSDLKVRFKIPVAVAYGTDVRLVEKILLQVAKENPDALNFPEPCVRFMEFGDNGLLFELRVWSTTLLHKKGKLVSDLNFAISDKFKENNIEIPFPQRDVHLRSASVDFGPLAK